jgi:hypothetical protein
MNPLHFVLATLALWRMTHLLSAEDGPWYLVFRWRKWLGTGVLGQAIGCFYCLSVWLALPLAAWLGTSWAERGLVWWALSGAACLLERATTRAAVPHYEEE